MTRIKTTHVGSLPRTQEVVDFIFARERAEPYDQAAFDAAMTDAVTKRLENKRMRASISSRTARPPRSAMPPMSRTATPALTATARAMRPPISSCSPAFWKRLANDGGTPKYARPMCMGEVKSKGQGELEKDIANLKAAMAAHGVERGFMNAASPGVISLFLQNDFYPTRDAYLAALADAMKEEYETIVAAGLDLQLDCPDLALSRHMLFTDLTDDEFLKVAASHVEALNHALSECAAGKRARTYLLGQLRRPARLRYPDVQDVRHADVHQCALCSV